MDTKNHSNQEAEWLDEVDGQLALDAYQTDDVVIIKAPIAGVAKEDLEIAVTDEIVTVKGSRQDATDIRRDAYFVQECYWGGFVRSYVLPVAVDADRAQATLVNGMLTITIPKLEKSKTRMVSVQAL